MDQLDLSSHQTFAGGFPHNYFRWLRDNHPVFWHEPTDQTPDGEGFWVVSRYDDVALVQRSASVFSSDKGGVRDKGGTAIKDERSAGTMLNMTDDPEHQRLRSLVNRGFTPRAIGELEDQLRQIVCELIDAQGNDPFDFVTAIARELPAQAICGVLGIPQSDRRELLDILDAGIEDDSEGILTKEAMADIRHYATSLIAAKRDQPDDAIMSTIIEAEIDGERLSDRELIAFFALLFPAGAETTRSALAGGVLAFSQNPEMWHYVAEEPERIPTAVEEVVRYTTPSIYKRRTASTATTIGDTAISRGDKVTFWEMSANFDERVFSSPFVFDPTRHPNPHLGFGWGPHFCLGASLARLELKVAFEELARSVASFETAGEATWMPNNRLLGLKSLPIRFHRKVQR